MKLTLSLLVIERIMVGFDRTYSSIIIKFSENKTFT
jgi:hypothetical protein